VSQGGTPTLDNPDPRAVLGVAAARRFFDLASTRRVDICLIGDLNARSQGTSGHEDAMGRAFAAPRGRRALLDRLIPSKIQTNCESE